MPMRARIPVAIALCWTVIVVLSTIASGQDTRRVPASNRDVKQDVVSVDASVHSDVADQVNRQPPSSHDLSVRPTSYSHWGFQSAKQPSTTRFWPAGENTGSASVGSTDVESSSPLTGRLVLTRPSREALQPSIFRPPRDIGLAISAARDDNSTNDGSLADVQGNFSNKRGGAGRTNLGPLTIDRTVSPPISQTDQYSSPFRARPFGPFRIAAFSTFSSSFPKAFVPFSTGSLAKPKSLRALPRQSSDALRGLVSTDLPSKQNN
jgi:hypothetical protein